MQALLIEGSAGEIDLSNKSVRRLVKQDPCSAAGSVGTHSLRIMFMETLLLNVETFFLWPRYGICHRRKFKLSKFLYLAACSTNNVNAL